ncbi:MAG: glycosyltransferase, partial [Nitrospira sp.]|nr:glycosyltransferase [Nitrospira sp.]
MTDASGRPDDDSSLVLQIERRDCQPASSGFQIDGGKATRMQQGAQLASTCGKEMAMKIDDYYTKLFVSDPGWSSPHPNQEEAARWCKIAGFLEQVVRYREREGRGPLRLLDVGCGRGWLTHLVSRYGTAEGLDPVKAVVDHARRLFPLIRFHVGTPEIFLAQSTSAPYDVVICSEVIEHVSYDRQEAFVASLGRLVAPGGFLILSTPRHEAREQWERIAKPCQPIEDWVTEAQVEELLAAQGFTAVGLERLHVEMRPLRYMPAPTPHELETKQLLPLYQVWLAQRNSDQSTVCSLRSRPPKVSVIVPTYNRPQRLKAALGSILSQTFQDFEIIVVNDGEESVEPIVRELDRQCRITLINHDRNRGLAAARNTGIRVARGKYIAYLDDDDRYLPDHLETLVTVLERGPYKAAYTDAWRVHERYQEGRYVEVGRDVPYSQEFSLPQLLIGNYFPVLCVMHERSCLEEVGFFDESLFAHEDWDLWIRLAEKFPFIHVKKVTAEFTWRTDGSSMTSGTRHTYYRTTDIIYRKYRPLAERFPGVPAAQERQLAEWKKQFQSDRFSCSIIIPVYNNLELTKQCLTALASATTGVDYEVILVDNGSTDGTTAFLQTLQGEVQVIRNEENRGFAKACNQGAKAARGKYLVFLNNDTIPQPNWLGPLVQEVEEHPEVGVVGSKLLYPDG